MNKRPLKLFSAISAITIISIVVFGYFAWKTWHHSYDENSLLVPSSAQTSAQTASSTIRILFTGDIMLDRAVAKRAQRDGFDSLFAPLVAPLGHLFVGNDMVIGNLEGSMTDNQSISQQDHSILRFTFDSSYAVDLSGIGFTGFSLSNNHSLDFGQDGFDQTQKNLADAGLISFGSPLNDRSLSSKITLKGKSVCFVGYLQLFRPDPTPVIDEIKRLRPQCDLLVTTAHWGVEYSLIEDAEQKELAHRFIDAGADMIIGSHPHVVEPLEVYHGKAIFYSLGNFMFDQDFSYNTEHGLAIEIEHNASSTKFALIPITIRKEQASISAADDRSRVLGVVVSGAKENGLSDDLVSDILKDYSFTLKEI
jgi:poly-gamma-glutamate synthesis protein (capsule biosynthesis protein)